MSVKARLKRLQREAEQGGIILRQRDGTTKVFDVMTCHVAMFMAETDLFCARAQRPPAKEVFDAVRNAVPEHRRAFEARFGPISFSVHIIESGLRGAWVERYTLLEDGSVQKEFFAGGSEEAERVRRECQEGGPRHH